MMLIDTRDGEGMLFRMQGLNLHLCHEAYSVLLSSMADERVRACEVARFNDDLGQTRRTCSL